MRHNEFPAMKRLWKKLCSILLIYISIGFLVVMLMGNIFATTQNPVLVWLSIRLDIIYYFYLVIGSLLLFYHYWKKPWNYLTEVIDATQTVYQQTDCAIELSEPLRDVENQMNQIKMSILLSEQAAKKAEDNKNELVMYLAHDIRTPLTTVIGYLSLLNEAPDMPTEQKAKFIGIAFEKAERLEMLINELFEITRYNTQTVTLTKKSIDLYALLTQVIEEFYPALSARGNRAEIFGDENLTIVADPEKLARVFNNLLKNAVAYSYPNTEITITTKRMNEYAVITFTNHGQTISQEQLATLFDKFNRLDEARLSDTGGAGLGLSIAKEIVNLHGGKITAQSENNTITFTMILPVSS